MYVDAFRGISRHLHETDISMGPEANIDAIRALEKQIEEGKGDIVKLKRDRNSLLNISTSVPPELLGYIFAQNLVRSWAFQGFRKGSYNFLLVCHHWFEVASNTPELWDFWGTTFQEWEKHHHRSRIAPVDLVLHEYRRYPGAFNKSLQDAVRSRVMQDTIRQVHLMSDSPHTLSPVISSLTPYGGGGQNENVESIALYSEGCPALKVSNFFTRSRLSRLRSLDLFGNILVPSWDRLIPRATLLTSLSLDITTESPPPPRLTAAQLFSILTSNPNLQELFLTKAILPNDTETSTFKVQLRHLKILSLMGEFRHLFGLLHQLILPEVLDHLSLTVFHPTVEDVSQTFAPYMRDFLRRDPRFQDRLGVSSSTYRCVSISVGVVCTRTAVPVLEPPIVVLTVFAVPNLLEQFFIDLIEPLPSEHVVFFEANKLDVQGDLFSTMPNIEILRISDVELSGGFLQPNPDGPRATTKLLPSLRSLSLQGLTLRDNDWGHLTTYLAHQTSNNQAISLEIGGSCPHLCLEVMKEVKDLVEEFKCDPDSVTTCPLGRCGGGGPGSQATYDGQSLHSLVGGRKGRAKRKSRGSRLE